MVEHLVSHPPHGRMPLNAQQASVFRFAGQLLEILRATKLNQLLLRVFANLRSMPSCFRAQAELLSCVI